MFRLLKNRSLMLVFGIMFLSMFTSSISRSVLVLFALELGSSVAEVGLISMIPGLISVLLQLPLGVLSDKFGRKLLILFSEIVAFLSMIAYSYAGAPWHLIAISPLMGFGGIELSGLVAAVGDLTEPAARPDALAAFYVSSSLGMLIGPSIASLLLLFYPLRTLFFLITAIRFLNILATFGITGLKKPSHLNYKENVARVLRKKNILVALDVRLSHGFFETVRRTYVPVLAKQHLNLPNALIASLGSFEGISRIGIRLFVGMLIRRVTAKRLILATFIIEGAVGLLLPFTQTFVHLMIFACLAGLLHGVESPTSALLVADSSTQTERGFATALLHLAMSSGSLAPAVTIPIADAWGIVSVFPVTAILSAVTLLITFQFMEPLSTTRSGKSD